MGFVKIPLLLGLIFLAACQGKAERRWMLNAPAIGPEASPANGVVLGSIKSVTTTFGIIPDTMQVGFVIKNPNSNIKDEKGKIKDRFSFENDNLDLSATEPGDYELSNFFINTSITNYDFASWNRKNGGVYGTFSVKPGEVIYIGHLFLDPQGATIHMRVEDRFDEMRAKLPPELANRLEKRLITLPDEITFDNQTKTPVCLRLSCPGFD